jgi:Raf kinase inhibitor-like YbhB/YbcL family protein
MRPSHAYVGIGFVFILAFIAFINPKLLIVSSYRSDTMKTGVEGTSMGDTFKLTSSAFAEGASIPSAYTCDASQASPPLSIAGAPAGTKTFALIMEDPDVPRQVKPDGVFLHWVVFNIPGSITEIVEGARIGVSGTNGAGKTNYVGPCPPAQYEPSEHRYVFTLYALDIELSLKAGATKGDVLKAMEGHVLSEAKLIGKYKRK